MIAPSAGRMWDADLASRALGMELVEAYEGRATVTMTVTDAMINGYGMAHGGYVFLLADSAFGCACNTYGPTTVASGGEIDFVRPVRVGEQLVAVAAERARYGRSGIYDVTIRRDGEVVAEMRGRSRILREGSGS
jgi:acyl-CoA thioesterase